MNGSTMGLVAGAAGGVVGVLGGVVGCCRSIKNTNGSRERAFMVRVSVLTGAGVTLFLVALFVTPFPYRAIWWLVYPFALARGIRVINRKQQQIRDEEAGFRA